MGVQISDIIPRREIELKELKGKTIAVDAFNTLYQFLTTIRQPDGTPLMDKHKKITSHLSGIFYRNINLLNDGIRPVYIFDGKPPELKHKERELRKEIKIKAEEKYKEAEKRKDAKAMRKFASQTVRITEDIVKESKELLDAMGIPVIQAEGEGEAEAAILSKNGKVWAAASQDYDVLLYGAPRLIRNLTLSRKRRTPTGMYVEIKPELIEFEKVVTHLEIDQDQLICLAILVGTDYNPGGIKGLGQKKALEIVQKFKYPVRIFEYVDKKYGLFFNWQEIFKQFHEYKSSTKEEIKFKKPNEEKIRKILLARDFSENRVESGIERLKKTEETRKQKGLKDFF